jgi:hypothetical protein
LQDNNSGLIRPHTRPHYVLEKFDVLIILDTIVEGHVERMMCTRTIIPERSSIIESSGAREELSSIVLMERQCHNTICGPECLFYAVAMMNIDIDVEDTRVVK